MSALGGGDVRIDEQGHVERIQSRNGAAPLVLGDGRMAINFDNLALKRGFRGNQRQISARPCRLGNDLNVSVYCNSVSSNSLRRVRCRIRLNQAMQATTGLATCWRCIIDNFRNVLLLLAGFVSRTQSHWRNGHIAVVRVRLPRVLASRHRIQVQAIAPCGAPEGNGDRWRRGISGTSARVNMNPVERRRAWAFHANHMQARRLGVGECQC